MNLKPLKITLIVLSSLGVEQHVNAQKPFEVHGTLTSPEVEGQLVLLNYYDGKSVRFDTTRVQGGEFRIAGTIMKPSKALFYVEQPNSDSKKRKNNIQEFFLEVGTTTITGTQAVDATITGGRSQREFAELVREQRAVGWQLGQPLSKAVQAKVDSVGLAFMHAHPDSEVSFALMKELATANFLGERHQVVETVYNGLSEAWRKSDDGQKIAQRIEAAKKLGVGKQAIDFTMNDTLGNPVSLSDFRGQYVFLDFWASWCMPCRAENPHVVAAYEQFKNKNFTVLGVSLDKEADRQKWLDAIHKDGLMWTHVSDLKGWDNAAARAYGIQSIPMNYLIDPEGKIVAVSLRGEALHEKLREILL